MKHIKNLWEILQKKIIKYGKKQLACILTAAVVVSLLVTIYNSIAASHINYMILSLNYEGAKQGLNPDGSRFNINEIKSDEVLKQAINLMGDDSLSVNAVKDRITIDSKMPLSAIEKTAAAIASGSTYSYNPSEFDIYYSQKKKFGKNNTVDFINSLSKAYSEYFFNKYSEKNNVLEFDSTETFEEYDYYEIKQVLTDKVNSMVSYLGRHQAENPTFRSTNTGYTFENLVNMLLNLRDHNLEKLEAYIVQNQISRDKAGFIRKQQYLADKEMLNYSSNIQASEIIRDALETYDPYVTGIAFIPSVDGNDEYYMSRTKTGLDNLAVKSYNKGITANGLKERIDMRNYLSSKFSEASVSEGNPQTADEMIEEICGHLEKISAVALLTDNEYISHKTKDYITFNLPEKSFKIPIIDFAKNLLAVSIVLLICCRILLFAADYLKDSKIIRAVVTKLNLKVED